MKGNNRIYISGPMTGIENYNKDAFDKAEKYLSDLGYAVFNPHYWVPFAERIELEYDEILEIDLLCLRLCDAIYMLDGWENSNGAKMEHTVALKTGKDIIYEFDSKHKDIREDGAAFIRMCHLT